MRKGFRVLVTERCNMACPTCFNRHLRTHHEMSVCEYERICRWLSQSGKIEKIKIMGGEPTTHRNFSSIIAVSQEYFPSLFLFTNAVNDVIRTVSLRESDTVIYNLACFPDCIDVRKLLPDSSCGHCFETRIDACMDTELVCHKLKYVHDILGERMYVNLTVDCTEEIFHKRASIIANWNEVAGFISSELTGNFNIDHDVPFCFERGEMRFNKLRPICSTACAGLITAQGRLRFCNQTEEDLFDLFGSETLPLYEDIDRLLSDVFHTMMEKNRLIWCRDCTNFGNKCNGGCFIHKIKK